MSKSNSLKIWIAEALLLIIALVAISINIQIPFGKNQQQFHNFAGQVTAILDQYNAEPNTVSFDINNDVLLANNQYYISIDEYTRATGDSVSMSNQAMTITHRDLSINVFDDSYLFDSASEVQQSQPIMQDGYLSLDTITNTLGYDYTVSTDSISLFRPFATNRLIVSSATPLVETYNAVAVASGYKDLYILQYKTEQDATTAYNNFIMDDTILSVEPDAIVYADSTLETEAYINTTYSSWGANSIGIDEYTEYLVDTVGTDNLNEMVVAVLDTGIDTDHPFFVNRMVGGANFTTSQSSTSYVYEDDHGHGTHVAGIVCDITLDNIKVMPVKVLNSKGYGYTSSILLGVEYVIQQKQAGTNICALNLSFGGQYTSAGTEYAQYSNAIANAYSAGIFSVVSSGNDGRDIVNYLPSNIPEAITVSAVGKSNNTYYCPTWSNYGSNVDISAPGAYVKSAKMGGGTVTMSGTSMAAPHVSACIALIKCDINQNYSMQKILDLIEFYATDLGTEGFDKYYGYGMINIGSIYADMLESLTFSTASTTFTSTENVFTEAFDLSITCTDSSANIYYTFGNTKPNYTDGTLYTQPIRITESTRINAVSYVIADGKMKKCSQVKTLNFYYYGMDVADNFEVDEDGTLLSYSGDFTEVTIPSVINGVTVTAIGNNVFRNNTRITEVHLPDSVTYVGRYSFEGCTALTTVYAPKVTKLDIAALKDCTKFNNLSDFYFPKLQEVGKYAFMNCYALTSACLKDVYYVDDYAFATNITLDTVDMPNLKCIGMSAFQNCVKLTTVNTPNVNTICSQAFVGTKFSTIALDNVVAIGNNVFINNINLTTLTLDKLQYVGIQSFYNCDALERLDCPELYKVSKQAFFDCDNLVSINMPNIHDIGTAAFAGCDNLQTANLPNLEYLAIGAFNGCAKLTTVTLSSIIDIQDSAFNKCTNLQTVTLSPNLLNIQSNAFEGINPNCVFNIYGYTIAKDFVARNQFTFTDLAMDESYFKYTINSDEVTITGYNGTLPEGIVIPAMIQGKYVTRIEAGAFSNCTQITEVNLTYLTSIGDNAFAGCTKLLRVNTASLRNIGQSAFQGCTALNDVYCPKVSTIGNYAFYKCSALLSLSLSESILSIGEYAIGYDYIDGTSVVIPVFTLYGYTGTIAETYATTAGITFEAIFNPLSTYYYILVNNDTEIHISWVNKYISGCLDLPSEYDGLPITGIADEAFYNCAFISAIRLPDSITFIGVSAFENCSMLSYINLNNVTSIGQNAFNNCCSLNAINLDNLTTINNYTFSECDNLSIVTAPKAISIGNYAFYGCINLSTISCPKLTIIGAYAFNSCYKLTDIDINLVEQIGEQGFGNCYMLTTMYLPKIQSIGNRALSDSGVNKLVCGKSITSVDLSNTKNLVVYGYNDTILPEHCEQLQIAFVPIQDLVITKDLLPNMELYLNNPSNTISVSNTGFEVKYQWYISLDGTPANCTPINNTTNTLTIDNSALTGAVQYFVKLTNWDGTVVYSTIASVSVLEAPFTFSGGVLPNATYATSYNGNIIPATDGEAFTYQLISGAPSGISITNGTLTGIPTVSGEFILVISATEVGTDKTMTAYFDLSVVAKNITVTINSASSVYGERLEELTYTYNTDEILAGDDLGIELQKANGKNVGKYVISGTSTNVNYNVTFENSFYYINPRPITIRLIDQTSQYGTTMIVNNKAYTVSSAYSQSVVYGDLLGVDIVKEEGDDVGEYKLTATCGNNNYSATIIDAIFTITVGSLQDIVTVSNCTVEYDGEYHWINVEFNKDVNPTIRYKLSSMLKDYNISAPLQESRYRDCIGMSIPIFVQITAPNYATFESSAILLIQPANVDITMLDKSSQYGTADVALEYIITDGEILETDISKLHVFRETGNAVGKYSINANITSDNYALNVKTGTYSIMPAPISVIIQNKISNYGDTMQDLGYNITNGTVYYDDDLGIMLYTNATNNSIPGSYVIRGAWDNPNYAVNFQNGTYTINQPRNTLLDTTNGILVYLGSEYSSNMTLDVSSVPMTDQDLVSGAKDEGFELKHIYNIRILMNDEEVELTKPIQIKMAYNQEMTNMRGVVLCDCTDKQNITAIESTIADGFLCFTTNTNYVGLATPCATSQQIGNIITALSIIIAFLIVTVVYTIYRNGKLKRRQADSKGNIKYRK